MGRRQSVAQVFSLVLLLLSALVMERIVSVENVFYFEESLELPNLRSTHWTQGVAPILLASLISGLSGALSQKNLQAHGGGRNPYLFSMELCAASSLILIGSFFFSSDGIEIARAGFWNGWTPLTWIPITTNAMGGIIVGLVTKHAGSVRKGFALIFGMLISGLTQAWLQPNVGVSKEQALGGCLAALSLYIHSTNPPSPKTKQA